MKRKIKIYSYITVSIMMAANIMLGCMTISKTQEVIKKRVSRKPKNIKEKLVKFNIEFEPKIEGDNFVITTFRKTLYKKYGHVKYKKFLLTKRKIKKGKGLAGAVLLDVVLVIPGIIDIFRTIDTRKKIAEYSLKEEINNSHREKNDFIQNGVIEIKINNKKYKELITNKRGIISINLKKLLNHCLRNRTFIMNLAYENNFKTIDLGKIDDIAATNEYKHYLAYLKQERIKKKRQITAKLKYYGRFKPVNNLYTVKRTMNILKNRLKSEKYPEVIEKIQSVISEFETKKDELLAAIEERKEKIQRRRELINRKCTGSCYDILCCECRRECELRGECNLDGKMTVFIDSMLDVLPRGSLDRGVQKLLAEPQVKKACPRTYYKILRYRGRCR